MRYFIFISLFFCVSLCVNAKKLFVTPEEFGCVSDRIEAAGKNSVALQKTIDYAIKKGVTILSSANKRYYISKGLVIKSPINIEFNRGTLIATDTSSMIVIDDGKGMRWSGKISGLLLDLNKKAKYGINCNHSVKLHISDCEIIGIPSNAYGINIERGYEVFVNNVHLLGGENYAGGIRIKTHDCHFSDCVMINCHTAVNCYGSNFFDKIHAWMGAEWLDNSVFFHINGGGPVFLNQCFSDTFDKAFYIDQKTELHITQQKNYHNKKMWKKDVNQIHPEFFHFRNVEVANGSKIFLDNSFIGNLWVGNDKRQVFSNIKENTVIVSNSVVQ